MPFQTQLFLVLASLAELLQDRQFTEGELEEVGLDWPTLLRLRETDAQLRDRCGEGAEVVGG